MLRQGSAWLEDVRLSYFGAPGERNDKLIVLTIDEEALAALPFRSPINRRYIAGVLDELADRKVRALGLDLIFDQPTIPADDQALLDALQRFPAPVVIAAGGERNGLTPRQLEFQENYLAGRTLGAASVLVTDGVVRHIYPGTETGQGRRLGFAAAIAASAGAPPLAAAERLYFRTRGDDGAPWIRSYPVRYVDTLPTHWFENAIVLIGADLPDQDRFATPLSVLGGEFARLPGVEIHAQAVKQLLSGERLPEPAAATVAAALAAAAVLGLGLPLLELGFAMKLAIGATLLIGYLAYAFIGFGAGAAAVPVLPPTLAFFLSMSFATARARHEERAERKFLRDAFQRYVSPGIIESVLQDPGKLALGGEKREMSFVFADLAGFTSLSERLAPEQLVTLLQSYFDGMLHIAFRHGGTIDRLIGDSVAVFFGAPAEQPDHAARAVRCVLEWDEYCEAFRREQRARGIEMGVTRIGAHVGTAVVGNVGSAERFHYTAHGDCVNTAARLESVNKHLGTRVCLSRAVALHGGETCFRPVARLVLKGRSEAIECVTTGDGLPLDVVEEYMEAYALLARESAEAEPRFARLLELAPHDPLIRFHLHRLRRGEHGETIVLEEK